METLGSINGYGIAAAWIGDQRFIFNGTTLGLVRSALTAGAVPGTRLMVNYGGLRRDNAMPFIVTATGGGKRTPGGVWASDARHV